MPRAYPFTTQEGQHLAGHGAYSSDGEFVLTPEHDYERVRGVVVVRDARSFSVVDEIDTHGIDAAFGQRVERRIEVRYDARQSIGYGHLLWESPTWRGHDRVAIRSGTCTDISGMGFLTGSRIAPSSWRACRSSRAPTILYSRGFPIRSPSAGRRAGCGWR